MFKKVKGVTLIELLVVIVILSLLVLSSFLVIPNQLKKARDARRKADLERIKLALYDYYFDKNCFPQTLPECNQDFSFGGFSYLQNFPCDSVIGSYVYEIEDIDCSQWFKVLTNLEIITDPIIDRVGCGNGCGPDCQYNYGVSSSNIRVYKDCVTNYACGPSGECVAYEDPEKSRCPQVFENDPSCGGGCDCKGAEGKGECCHDESGKHVPYIEGPTSTPKPTKVPSEKGKGKN